MGRKDLADIHGTVEEGREKLTGRLDLTVILGTPRPLIGRKGSHGHPRHSGEEQGNPGNLWAWCSRAD
jgi:hypothetical protein